MKRAFSLRDIPAGFRTISLFVSLLLSSCASNTAAIRAPIQIIGPSTNFRCSQYDIHGRAIQCPPANQKFPLRDVRVVGKSIDGHTIVLEAVTGMDESLGFKWILNDTRSVIDGVNGPRGEWIVDRSDLVKCPQQNGRVPIGNFNPGQPGDLVVSW